MNLFKFLFRCAMVTVAVGAGLILIPAGHAQLELQAGDDRFLFIFDTSADMKKRLPALKTEMDQVLATSLGGQLNSGNSIGVWTFDQNLRSGQFPVQHWRAEDAAAIAKDINSFVSAQHYANSTRFDALQPSLNQVIQKSVRLTVLIFCDGGDKLNWTPYADGVNQAFQQRLAEQRKAKQPFVLLLRTQLGKFTGCTMNFSPGMLNVPPFPRLPPPPPPVNAPPAAPVVKPPPVTPLIIIGTNIFTNWPPPAPPKVTTPPPVMPTNPITPAPPTNPAPLMPTNIAPVVSINPVTTEKPVVPSQPTNPPPAVQADVTPPQTNSLAPVTATPATPAIPAPAPPPKPSVSTSAVPPPEDAGTDHKGLLMLGAALAVVAGALAVFAFVRGRGADRGSLISRSMRKD